MSNSFLRSVSIALIAFGSGMIAGTKWETTAIEITLTPVVPIAAEELPPPTHRLSAQSDHSHCAVIGRGWYCPNDPVIGMEQ